MLVVVYAGLSVFIPTFLGYLFLGNKFANELRARHKAEWLKLGSPDVSDRGSDKSKFLVYLGKRKYLPLNDESLTRLGSYARAALLISTTSLAITCIDGITMFFMFAFGG